MLKHCLSYLSLITVLALSAGSCWGQASGVAVAGSPMKSSGVKLHESRSPRSSGALRRVPTKAQVYGQSGLASQPEFVTTVSGPFKPLSASQQAPGRNNSGGEERVAQGILIYSDELKATNKVIELPLSVGAVSEFKVVSDGVPSLPYKNYGEQVVNGVAFDGQFMASTFCEMIYTQSNLIYDTSDWKLQYQYDYKAADLEMTAVTYDITTGMAFGVFQGTNPETKADEWFFGKWVDPSSYTRPEPISWLGSSARWYGLAVDGSGQVYALDGDCNLLKVDKLTGATELVGNTGLSNQYKTCACYDVEADRILFLTSVDSGSAMYSIDPSNGKASMLYALPGGEQVIGMFIPGPKAADKAPAAAENLKAEFPLGSTSGAITFDVPAVCFDGTPLAGSVSYEVRLDGELVGSGTAAAGAAVSASLSLEASVEGTVTVQLKNAAGASPMARATLFCGTPTPRPPYFTQPVAYNEAEGCMELKWGYNLNNLDGSGGGTIDPAHLEYQLVRYPGGKVINVGKGVTELKDPFTPSENFELVYYTLSAVYYGQNSKTVKSNAQAFGTIQPPFHDEFLSDVSAAAYTTVSTPNDTEPWMYIGPVTPQKVQHGWMYHGSYGGNTAKDSYLVMPAMKLEKGKVYTLTFEAAASNPSCRNERLAVYLGKDKSEDGLRQVTISEPVRVYNTREEQAERYNFNFSAPDDGLYYLSFHHCSYGGLRYLYVGDISISAPVDPNAPQEVSALRAVAGTNGELKVSLSCTLPTKNIAGMALSEKTRIKLLRDGQVIDDAQPSGSTYTFVDRQPMNGVNNYEVVPYNSKGEGLHSTVNVFVGVGKPENPKPLAWTGATGGQAVVKWTPAAQDEFGTALSLANTRYDIQREWVSQGRTEREVIAENLSALEYTDAFCSDDAPQTFVSYWVRAVTDGGTSQWVSTRKIGLGKPYEVPFEESFANKEMRYNWTTVGSDQQWLMADDGMYDDVKSVDGDNGFLLVQAQHAQTPGLFYSGTIEIPADMPNPVYSFYYLDQDKYQGEPVKNLISVFILDSEGQKYGQDIVCNGEWGWKRVWVDLNRYKGQRIQVGVYMECVDRPNNVFDAFRIATRYDHDLGMVTVAGPEEVQVGQPAVLTVNYENLGAKDVAQGEYVVELYHGAEKVAEAPGAAIKSDARASVNFTIATNPTLGEEAEYHVVVRCGNDQLTDNNTSRPFTLKIVNNVGYPEPSALTAERLSDKRVSLTWQAPDMEKTPRQTYTEDFEQFDSFAKQLEGWTLVDEDQGIVQPINSQIQTPESWGSPFGFFVQDNVTEPFCRYEEFTPYSGHKYMASQHTTNAVGNEIPNSDWLISPELSGFGQVASFMGKSISSSWPEAFKVYYSSTGTDLDDFVFLGGVDGAPASWMHYTVTLPEGARYFAIQCVSEGCLQFMVDDVTLSLKSCPPIALTLKGYNVYRDGMLLNSAPVTDLAFTDEDSPAESSHTYHVTALYAEGESVPSEASTVTGGIASVDADQALIGVRKGAIIIRVADDARTAVYSVAGVCLHQGLGAAEVAVLPGVYVVSAGGHTAKVVVE